MGDILTDAILSASDSDILTKNAYEEIMKKEENDDNVFLDFISLE